MKAVWFGILTGWLCLIPVSWCCFSTSPEYLIGLDRWEVLALQGLPFFILGLMTTLTVSTFVAWQDTKGDE